LVTAVADEPLHEEPAGQEVQLPLLRYWPSWQRTVIVLELEQSM